MRAAFGLLALGLSAVLAGPERSYAQGAEPWAARRVVIYNGSVPLVEYDVRGLSPRLQGLYRALAVAENELTLSGQLGTLKMDYVDNERALEASRTRLQLRLNSSYGLGVGTPYASSGGAYARYPGGGSFQYSSYGGAGGYGGYGRYGAGLANGSVLKNAITPSLAFSSTADYRLRVIQNLQEAQENLEKALALEKGAVNKAPAHPANDPKKAGPAAAAPALTAPGDLTKTAELVAAAPSGQAAAKAAATVTPEPPRAAVKAEPAGLPAEPPRASVKSGPAEAVPAGTFTPIQRQPSGLSPRPLLAPLLVSYQQPLAATNPWPERLAWLAGVAFVVLLACWFRAPRQVTR